MIGSIVMVVAQTGAPARPALVYAVDEATKNVDVETLGPEKRCLKAVSPSERAALGSPHYSPIQSAQEARLAALEGHVSLLLKMVAENGDLAVRFDASVKVIADRLEAITAATAAKLPDDVTDTEASA